MKYNKSIPFINLSAVDDDDVVETLQCNVSTGGHHIDKFRGKYRVASTRLKTWDYAWNGFYFITICTKDRINHFGDIMDGKMHLNEFGRIAHTFGMEIPQHFDNARIDAFVVMPNHVHGILVIDNGGDNVDGDDDIVETLHCNVSTTTKTDTDFYSQISPKPKSLSTMIRSYKSICTKTINRMPVETLQCNVSTVFAWQSRFYEHIIRDEKSLENIRNYIINNPAQWEEDENNLLRKVEYANQ